MNINDIGGIITVTLICVAIYQIGKTSGIHKSNKRHTEAMLEVMTNNQAFYDDLGDFLELKNIDRKELANWLIKCERRGPTIQKMIDHAGNGGNG